MSCSRIAELRINSLIQHSIPCQVLIQLKWFKRKRRVNDLTLPDSGFRKWETINSDIHCRPFSLHVPPIPINNQISLNSIINAIIARKKSFRQPEEMEENPIGFHVSWICPNCGKCRNWIWLNSYHLGRGMATTSGRKHCNAAGRRKHFISAFSDQVKKH